MKLNLLIIIIFIICIYHYFIQNRLEKIFCKIYLNKDFEELIKRPLKKCIQKNTNKCMGMPSAHSETITIFGFLLYFYKIIPLWICLFLICIFSFQRVASNMHSIIQVFVGILIGFFYALLYKKLNLSLLSFIIVIAIGLILITFIQVAY
jgi:membrane-associated phospholipid phosphatase